MSDDKTFRDDDVEGHRFFSDKNVKDEVEPTSFEDETDEDTEAHAFKWSDATLKSDVELTSFDEHEDDAEGPSRG